MRSYSLAVSSTVSPSRMATRCSVSRVRSPTVMHLSGFPWAPPEARRSMARIRAFSSRMLKGLVM